jgi:hypothetical protein
MAVTESNNRNGYAAGTQNHDMDYDIETIRKQFPALRSKQISMNNAAGSLVYQGAIDS